MPAVTWISHHRLLTVGVGATVLAATVVLWWLVAIRSPATPIGVGQALRLYRQGRGARSPDVASLPPAGVYTYRTSGSEHLSLGGITRTFPGSTEMIVTDSRCATLTWEPFAQHVEGTVVCPVIRSGLRVSSFPSSEEVAGVRTTSDVRCPADAYLVPPDPRPAAHWSATCRTSGDPVELTGEVVGTSTVTVGGHAVPALHTRLVLAYAGARSGRNPADYWWLAPVGLVLRERQTLDLTQSSGPIGSIHYSETVDMTLESLTPAR